MGLGAWCLVLGAFVLGKGGLNGMGDGGWGMLEGVGRIGLDGRGGLMMMRVGMMVEREGGLGGGGKV